LKEQEPIYRGEEEITKEQGVECEDVPRENFRRGSEDNGIKSRRSSRTWFFF
jgi:hypothetical protein